MSSSWPSVFSPLHGPALPASPASCLASGEKWARRLVGILTLLCFLPCAAVAEGALAEPPALAEAGQSGLGGQSQQAGPAGSSQPAGSAGQAQQAGLTGQKADESAKNEEAPEKAPVQAPVFTWGGYFQALGFLFLLLALLWLAVWAVRRSGKFNFLPLPGALPRDALRVEGQLPLGPKSYLVVVRFLNRRLLLAVSDQPITLLKDLDLTDADDDPQHHDDCHHEPHGASGRAGSSHASAQLFARLLAGTGAGVDGRPEPPDQEKGAKGGTDA